MMIARRAFPSGILGLTMLLLLFVPFDLFALNRVSQPTFGAVGNWIWDNNVSYGALNTFSRNGGGYSQGVLTTNEVHRDGMLHQTFLTPDGPTNAKIRTNYRTTNTANYISFGLIGTLRDTTIGGPTPPYNEALVLTFLNRTTLDLPWAWNSSGWSAEAQLEANRTYRIQIYHDINLGATLTTNITAHIDNLYCNISPRNLVAAQNGANVDLTWSTSTGVGTTLDHYRVWRSATGVPGSFVFLSDNPAGDTTYTDVAPGALYYYAVSDVEVETGDESPLSLPVFPRDLTMAGAITVDEDTDSAAITDFDCTGSAACYPVTIILTVSNGTLTMTNNGCTTFNNNGTSGMTIAGSQTALNNTLDTLVYRGNLDFSGADSLNMSFGGIDKGNVAITVNPINDAPTVTMPGAQSVYQNGALVLSTGNGNLIDVNDDSGAGEVSVTLTATNGTVKLAGLGGLTITGGADDSNTVSFKATIADVRAALDGLTFSPDPDYLGAASIDVAIDDQGNTGSGGALNDSDTLSITVVVPPNTTPPTGLQAVALGTALGDPIFLSWDPSVENPGATVANYELFLADMVTFVATLGPTITDYTHVFVMNPQSYVIRDIDSNGQISPFSAPVTVSQSPFPVRDGPGPDITWSWLTDRVEANWPVASTTVQGYVAAVGTTPGKEDVVGWTSLGGANKAVFTGLTLASGTTYYTSVKMLNQNGGVAGIACTNGFTIRGDQRLVDDDAAECFHNRRVAEQIDFASAGEIKPVSLSGTGGTGLWRFRKTITITEPGVTDRVNAPCRVTFNTTDAPGVAPGSVNEYRVTDQDGNECRRYNLAAAPAGLTNPNIVFLVNMRRGETKTYDVWWGNSGVSDQAHGFILAATQPSTIEWTPYYSRKLMPAGLETVPLAYNYGYRESPPSAGHPGISAPENNTEEFEYFTNSLAGNYYYNSGSPGLTWRDDARSCQITLFGGTFPFYGLNVPNWYVWVNGLLYTASTQWNTCGTGNNNTDRNQFRGSSARWTYLICPMWADVKYDMAGYPPNPGVYRDALTNPTREVFTWRCNVWLSAGVQDDIYVFQTVLYPTGDICHRYGFMSPRALNGGGGYGDPVVNTAMTAGLSRTNGTNYLTNTPLVVGDGANPTSFYQCMDAFSGANTVYGPITGAAAGVVDVAHFESMVFDSRMTSPDWYNFLWDADVGGTGQIRFLVRSGATPDLTGTWNLITTVNADGAGSVAIPDPPVVADERYIQYRCEFQRSGAPGAPVLPVLRRAEFQCRGLSIETVVASTPLGVSQGQDGIKVQVAFKNTFNDFIQIDSASLTFSLGSYTVTQDSIENGGVATSGGTIFATYSVNVWDDSPTGSATVDCQATASVVLTPAVKFSDLGAQTTHSWRVLKKATLIINFTDTTPTTVNKGQESIPVRAFLENTGEVPFAFSGATLTFDLGVPGDYLVTLVSPASDTIVVGPGSITAQFSVNVLLTSPSGVARIDATAAGTNTFSQKLVEAPGSLVLDSWIIQNPSNLLLTEIVASDTVFRGQTNAPILLKAVNDGEATAIWASSVVYFTPVVGPVKTYLQQYPVSTFPVSILGGGASHWARYGVDIAPLTATGTDDIEPMIWRKDDNSKQVTTYTPPLPLASWTIIAEQVRTFKDAAFQFSSSSFNQPLSGTRIVYAQGIFMAPLTDFVVRWYDPDDPLVEVASSGLKTANASGTLSDQFVLTTSSPIGNWTVKITDPLNTYTACQNTFEVVSPASLSVKVSLPPSISVGQPFTASMTFINAGGAGINGAYSSPLQTSGVGGATQLNGPIPLVWDIPGYGQATFTWDYRATSPGTFTASATGYGFDKNSDECLTSAYSSASINIQNPPNVSITAVVATPTIVYRNQSGLAIQVGLKNAGSATAVLQAASLTFTLGTYSQTLSSPAFPSHLAGSNAAATLTFAITVDQNSPTGLSAFSCNLLTYDLNFPASIAYLNNPVPNRAWTIASVGILLANNLTYNPQAFSFNQGQTVRARAFGLPPNPPSVVYYRVRFYNRQVANSGVSPAGEITVSPMLQTNANGEVDFFIDLAPTATLGTWSVEIESDADLSSVTHENMLAVQLFQVQTPGTLVASLTLSPVDPFEGDLITATLDVGNALSTAASLISPATMSTLVPAGPFGGVTYVSGPTPASVTVEAMATGTFVWTYLAASSTGLLPASFSMTTVAASSATGVDTNSGSAANGSSRVISNGIRIFRRELSLTATNTWDQGSIGPGEVGALVPNAALNNGNATLSAVLWNTVDLNGPAGAKIPYSNLTLSPSPVATVGTPLPPVSSRPVTSQLSVPYNQAAGDYIATMTLFEDLNSSGNRDPLEPYVLFAVTVNVPSKKNILVTESLVDLGNWPPSNFTGSQTVTIMNIGNLDLTNLRLVDPPVATGAFFRAFSLNPGPLTVAVPNTKTIEVSADIPPLAPAFHGVYVATWTVYDDTGPVGFDPLDASTTFQVRVNIGLKDFTLISPVDMGNGTPSTVLPSKPLTITNAGSLPLTALRSRFTDLSTDTYIIASNCMNIVYPTLVPAPPDPLSTKTASVTMVVPAGTPAGSYTGTLWVYEDINGNGQWNASEASASFVLMVSVPRFPAIEVQAPTVSFGDLTEGALATVTFNCKNTGNVDLTQLRWVKVDLVSGGNVIPASEYSFPPTNPATFTALSGAFFTRVAAIEVPNPQAFGDYNANVAWLYDDTDIDYPVAKEGGEPQSSFIVHCKVGLASITIIEAQASGTGDPGSLSPAAGYTVKNIGNLTLTRPTATASVLTFGANSISATASLFTPNPMGNVIPGQFSPGQWQVAIPGNTTAGVYLGTLTEWNDANVNSQIDLKEASASTVLRLTVNSKKIIDVLENPLNLGLATAGALVQGMITIRNTGNLLVTHLRGQSGLLDFGPGIDNIPVINSTFTTNPIGSLAVGETTYATVSVQIKAFQALGPYSGTFRVFGDFNLNGVCDATEIYKDFPVVLEVGRKAITVTSPPASFGAQDPNTNPSTGFQIQNTGSFQLVNVTWMPGAMTSTESAAVIPAASTTFPPGPIPPFTLNAGSSQNATGQLAVGPFLPPGTYIGTHTVWEDTDGLGTIDAGEASATFQTRVTVNAVPGLTLVTKSVAFGAWNVGETTTPVEIGFQNTGNTTFLNGSFSWTFADLQDGLGNTIPVVLMHDAFPTSVAPGAFATTTVYIGPLPSIPLGMYTRQVETLTADGVSDVCTFTLGLVSNVGPVPPVGPGSLYQVLATATFLPNVAPDNRYILSGWVCPGSGAVAIGFHLADSSNTTVSFTGVQVSSTGAILPLGSPLDVGIVQTVSVTHPVFGPQTWYRIYAAFDYIYAVQPASPSLVLRNESPTTASYSIWVDGVQLERAVFLDQTRPTVFEVGRKIISPNRGLSLNGDTSYCEW